VETRTGTSASGGANQTATLVEWDGCAAGVRVAHWRLTDVGHGWPGYRRLGFREDSSGPSTTLVVAADEIWRFFAPLSR
jgi:poly(3-hydroxybutyrate) depolymerase